MARAAHPTRAHRAIPALLLAAIACGPVPAETRQRLVLITLDTLRNDSFAGRAPGTTDMPKTRELARRGRVFRRHYSATSTTQPTHASIFTGLHPWQHGVARNGVVLDPGLETVVERMRARGFQTGAVVASFPLHRRFGFDQGFERFDDSFTAGPRQRWIRIDVPGERFYSTADVVTDRALALLGALPGEKQFFWFHYFDAHGPYGDSPGGETLTLVGLKKELTGDLAAATRRVSTARSYYDRDVRFMDAALGRLYERLSADAAAEGWETHIVVASDHGESFGEGGSLGHGENLTPEQIHVPLLVVSPRVTAGTSDRLVGSVDVAATLDALAGGGDLPGPGRDLTRPEPSTPDGPDGFDGSDARPVVGMRRTYEEPYEDVRIDGSIHLVKGHRFYLVRGEREFTGGGDEIAANDAAPVGAEERRHLSALFRSFEAELVGREPGELLDAETREALEALGYVR